MRRIWGAVLLLLSILVAGANAQTRYNGGCGYKEIRNDAVVYSGVFEQGIERIPRNAVRPRNLAWELPIAAATGLLIAKGDHPADNRIQSASLQSTAGRWSNIGIGIALASGAAAYGAGCHNGDHYLRDTGLMSLAAVGMAGVADLALKVTFNRQFPYTPQSKGEFWEGGRSFPSGHAATSFAFASVVAHRYPDKKWLKWGAYALATGITMSRYPAKKHFLSDMLVGATLGYATGAYMGKH